MSAVNKHFEILGGVRNAKCQFCFDIYVYSQPRLYQNNYRNGGLQ